MTVEPLACTSTELLYLASLREGQSILGVENPLRGVPEAEVDARLREARDALSDRGWIRLEPDATVAIDFDVARVVDVVARPRRTVLAYLATPDSNEQRTIFVRGSLTVELIARQDEVYLAPMSSRDAVGPAVLRLWRLEGQEPAPGAQTVLPQQALHEATELAGADPQQCQARLLEAGVSAHVADSLASTLARPRGNGALLISDGSASLGLGMLSGDNGLWRLRQLDRDGVPCVELEPCAATDLAEIVREFVKAALS